MLVVLSLAAGVVGLSTVIFVAQRRLLFPAPQPPRPPRSPGARVLSIPFACPGVRAPAAVVALYHPASQGAPTLVHFHGNGEQLADLDFLSRRSAAGGLGFFAVEYPGYGMMSALPPSEDAIYAAADAALRYLQRDLGVPAERIVLQGQSLGTGVATEMARRGLGARLVLLSPYTSIAAVAAHIVPVVPLGLLVRDRFDSLGRAPACSQPTLVIHGEQDELIPVALGRRLAAALPRADLWVVPGAHHNDLWEHDEVFGRIDRFARGAE